MVEYKIEEAKMKIIISNAVCGCWLHHCWESLSERPLPYCHSIVQTFNGMTFNGHNSSHFLIGSSGEHVWAIFDKAFFLIEDLGLTADIIPDPSDSHKNKLYHFASGFILYRMISYSSERLAIDESLFSDLNKISHLSINLKHSIEGHQVRCSLSLSLSPKPLAI